MTDSLRKMSVFVLLTVRKRSCQMRLWWAGASYFYCNTTKKNMSPYSYWNRLFLPWYFRTNSILARILSYSLLKSLPKKTCWGISTKSLSQRHKSRYCSMSRKHEGKGKVLLFVIYLYYYYFYLAEKMGTFWNAVSPTNVTSIQLHVFLIKISVEPGWVLITLSGWKSHINESILL